PDFSGTVAIDVALDGPQPGVVLRAAGLTIDDATAAGQPARATASSSDETVTIRFAGPLKGDTTVVVRFHGRLGGPDGSGLYQHERAVCSAFDPDGARHAFPCFDDVPAKIPWTLTLVVPRGETALATSAIASSVDEEAEQKR